MAYVKKEAIVEFITKGLNNPDKTKAFGHDAIEILTEIEYAPTADVVEVVRCKDCKHFGRDMGHGKHDCKKYEMPYCLENDYCSYGERRTEERK